MEKKTMGTFLSALRRAKGMTQQEVADRLLVSNRAVSRWERDDTVPDITLLPAIADLFEVTVDELLRGERRRSTVDPPHGVPESGDTMTDTPPTDVPPPRPDTRALRGMRALCKRTRSRFSTLLLVAAALIAAGYVAMLGIVYGLERVYIGFAVFCLCCVGSAVLSILAIALLRDLLGEQAPDTTECRLPEADIVELLRVYGRGCFAGIAAPVVGIALALPLVLYKKSTYFGQAFMMDWRDYLLLTLFLAGGLSIAGWLFYHPYQTALQGKWAAILDIPAPTGYAPARSIVLRRLNLRQAIAAVAGFGGGLLLYVLIMAVTVSGRENEWLLTVGGTMAIGMQLAGLLLPIILLVVTHRRIEKADRTTRRNVLLSGWRNVVVSLTTGAFWTTGIGFISSGKGDNYAPTLNWTPQAIAVWVIVTLALFGVTALIRRRIGRT